MPSIVIGGMGFVGRELVKKLSSEGQQVVVIDLDLWNNFEKIEKARNVKLIKISEKMWANQLILELEPEAEWTIWHLAANSDISKGASDYCVDYELTLGSTIEVIKLAQLIKVKKIHFTSSSAVYGEGKKGTFFKESDSCSPISNYGVNKLASEMLLQNFCQDRVIILCVYRLANIIGPNMTHGVLYDFKRKIMENNSELQVLGNGNQTKTYFHVDDLVSIMLHFDSSSSSDLLINTGCGDNGLAVKEIAELVCQKFAPAAKIEYENSDRGWKGDSPISLLDTSKLDREYPYPKLSSREVVISVLDADV